MTQNEFVTNLKTLVDQWKADYLAHHAEDPESWPMHDDNASWYEDFSVWLELRELHL